MDDFRELYQQLILDHNQNPRNFRAINDGLTHGPSTTGDEIKDSFGQAGITEACCQHPSGIWCIGSRFEYNGISSNHGPTARSSGQRSGEIKRGNNSPNAIRFQDAAIVMPGGF